MTTAPTMRTYLVRTATIVPHGIMHTPGTGYTVPSRTRPATVLKRAALERGLNLDPVIYWHGPVLCAGITGARGRRLELSVVTGDAS